MKAILICPGECPSVAALAETAPLSSLPMLGKPVIEYWLEHLASRGAKQVYVLATDRPEQTRAVVGDGARWGLRVEVLPEIRELSCGDARAKYCEDEADWLSAPDDVALMDRLPALPDRPLFTSYADWFAALEEWMAHAATPDRIGMRETRPGVWLNVRARVAPGAQLRAPCWIGENAYVGAGAIIGPIAVVEEKAYVEEGAEISQSVIGPETFVGASSEITHSIAWGNTLTNWKFDSCVKVTDAFLLCSLARQRLGFEPVGAMSRLAAALVMALTLPFALLAGLVSRLRGLPALRPLVAIRPGSFNIGGVPGDTLVYYDLPSAPAGLRRWPQLWNIVRGDFAWIGNRPLSPRQAAALTSDFERLWLSAPLGFISLADVEARTEFFSDEARAHASYYAAQASRRLDVAVFARALFLFAFGISYSRAREQFPRVFPTAHAEGQKAH